MKTLIRYLIVAAAAAIVAPAAAAPRDAQRGDFRAQGLTAEQFDFYTATQRERASQQPLWAPNLNDRNAVY